MAEQTHSFGYWLRRRRKALDLTQEQLAASVACSHFAIRKLEADERRPSKALAERLASRLGVAPAERETFVAVARGMRGAAALPIEGTPLGGAPTTVAGSAPLPPPTARASARDVELRAQAPGPGFVGRDAELAALEAAAESARAGAGQVVLLAGQPGIGKTRTAQAIAERAAAQGMAAYWGRCPEEPGAPPYWPWVQLLRACTERLDPRSLAAALGQGARWIADLVPDLPGVQPAADAPRSGASDAAQARFRLFDAIAGFWRRVAGTDGAVIVLDDLHWADASSLRLLEFVVAETAGSRLLVIGTYRDGEVHRRHPLTDTLSALARSPGFARLPLSGLSLDEARALVGGDGTALARLHAQTEGNPFYLTEMARLLAAPHPGSGPMRRLPAGVRAAIGSRLNRLSADCNRVLAAAAVIGREFEWAVLVRVVDGSAEDACVAALEEALAAGVVDEGTDADTYRFSHALIRETLYDEIAAIRRPRLHHRVAVALEAVYRHDPEPPLSRLAFHFGAAMVAQGAQQALDYSRRAGEHAIGVGAYEDAARFYADALDALSIVERRVTPDTLLRCDLMIRRGEAQVFAADYATARDTLRTAADLAMAGGSGTGLARAAVAFEDASWRPGLSGDESIGLLRAALDRIGDGDALARARVLASLTRALIFTGATDEAIASSELAVSTARRAGDPVALAGALIAGLSARWVPARIDERLRAASEAIAIARRIGQRDVLLEASAWRLFDLMEMGVDAAFLHDLREYERLADELPRPFHVYTAASFGPALALMSGDLAESERRAEALRRFGERQPGLDAAGVYATQVFTLRREQGELRQLAPVVRRFVATTAEAGRWRPGLALVYAELGMLEEARREFDALAAADFADVPHDAMRMASIAYLSEVCAMLGDRRRAATLRQLLWPYRERNLLAGTSVACFGAASRFLGLLAATEDRVDDAIDHLRHAIAFNARQGATTWLAHAQVDCARALAARGSAADRVAAATLVAEAADTARAHGLAALSRRIAELDGPPPAGATPAARPPNH
jgi:DNA-binding XRE family transcriptional regulator/tetratricopeptide (TPR) repeat protein